MREVRHMLFTSDLKQRSDGEEKRIEGYFIVFNQETRLYGSYYEQIASTAVTKSLENNDIRCLFNHNDQIVLGRLSNSTLTLKADDKGLYGSVVINPNDREAMDIYARVERGDINACSFGFYPLDESVEERADGTYLYTVKDADILEVSVVTFPAYPTTEVSARKADIDRLQTECLEKRKAKMKERILNA